MSLPVTPSTDAPLNDDNTSVPLAPADRRSKPQLSCNLCRRRKLRCDRRQPCSTCSGRGLALSCEYPGRGPYFPAGAQRKQPPSGRARESMQNRLSQLEQIVESLMQKSNPKDGGPSSGSDGPASRAPGSSGGPPNHHFPEGPEGNPVKPGDSPSQSDSGRMWFSSSELQYVGETHWAAILDGIADLRAYLEREEDDELEVPQTPHTLLLYRCKTASKEEILAALPPKPVVDRYISQYFNRLDLAPSCLHNGQFLREYEQFWETPSEAPIMWLGLLFSMICLAVLASAVVEYPPEEGNTPLLNTYREKIVQCLILGEYTRSGRYTLETLYHYLTVEYSIRQDADKDIWILLGIIVNLALRMGYHRDSSHLRGIPPLAGEMRRRVWATVIQGDILISTQMGMPRMIKDWQSDTALPHNLNDSDFNEDTQELPPSRPDSEITTVSHLIARRRIFYALGIIVDLTAAVQPCSYAEVMRVDGILRGAEATIPAHLRMKTMASAVTDPPQVIMHRLFLRLMFHKGQIMLHRKNLHLNQGPLSNGEDPYIYSRRSCLEAALGILEIQRIFDEETGPDGQLHIMRWRVSSFAKHEFLTATMVLCFLGQHGLEKLESLNSASQNFSRDDIMTTLKRAHDIWTGLSHSSTEARTAADALSIVLAKVIPQNTGTSEHNDHELHRSWMNGEIPLNSC